jgi:hypothetical protein
MVFISDKICGYNIIMLLLLHYQNDKDKGNVSN